MPDSNPPPPRIGFNALLLSVDQGYRAAGIHRYIVSLLAAMAETDGASVTAFVPEPWPDDILPPQIRLWRAPAATTRPLSRVLWEQAGLPSALAKTGAQVYHGAAYAMPTAARCPSVVTVHDLSPFRHSDSLPRWQGYYLRAATRHAARRADAVVAVSKFTAAELQSVLNVDPARIHVVPNGVDAAFGQSTDHDIADVRKRLQLPETFLLTLGTLQPRKNLGTLLEAYSRVRSSQPAAPDLVVVGGAGWGDVDAISMAEELGIAAHVHVLGYVADHDLPALYAGALAFMYPSRYEGFGLPVLESMASGTPTIVATGSSLTEVSGDDAPTAAPDEPQAWAAAIESMIDDDGSRARLAEAGRTRAERFTWGHAARSTVDVYQAVLASRDGPSAAVGASGG